MDDFQHFHGRDLIFVKRDPLAGTFFFLDAESGIFQLYRLFGAKISDQNVTLTGITIGIVSRRTAAADGFVRCVTVLLKGIQVWSIERNR